MTYTLAATIAFALGFAACRWHMRRRDRAELAQTRLERDEAQRMVKVLDRLNKSIVENPALFSMRLSAVPPEVLSDPMSCWSPDLVSEPKR